MMKSKTTGQSSSLRALNKAIGYLNKKIPFALQEGGNKMVAKAKSNHDFTTRSGQAERSIQADVVSKDWQLIFWINPDRVTSGNYNYAWGLHDGTGTGYLKSMMSPIVKPKLKSGGIKHDHFMVRAYEGEIKNLQRDIANVIKGAFR